MNDLERLIAVEEIKKLKARYFRGVDLKDWALLEEEVFAEDVEVDYRGAATDPRSGINFAPAATGGLIKGRQAVVSALKDSLQDVVSAHQGFLPEIEFTGPKEANMTLAMYDCIAYPPEHELYELCGYGHYYDVCIKIGTGWRIEKIKLIRTRVEITRK